MDRCFHHPMNITMPEMILNLIMETFLSFHPVKVLNFRCPLLFQVWKGACTHRPGSVTLNDIVCTCKYSNDKKTVIASVDRRLNLTLFLAIKRPPRSSHPGSYAVFSLMSMSISRDRFNNWMSISFGRMRQSKPAVSHVVPAVNLYRSNNKVLTPSLVKWYKVWHPALPPPVSH